MQDGFPVPWMRDEVDGAGGIPDGLVDDGIHIGEPGIRGGANLTETADQCVDGRPIGCHGIPFRRPPSRIPPPVMAGQ
jgi:hypothetical protein